jgi:signal transduction histidine kinase
VRDETGGIARLIGVTQDITERKRMEERQRDHEQQLFQAAKLASLGTLVSGIAHEINNPNNFILLNSQNLKELWQDIRPVLEQKAGEADSFDLHGLPFPTARAMVEDLMTGIEEGSKRIARLVLNLRDFARGDDGQLNDEVDVNAVIDSAVMITGNLIRKSSNAFSVVRAAGLTSVRGSAQQLEQVIINLLTNACQSLPSPDRRVSVETKTDEEDHWVVIEVTDEGMGIPEQNLPRVTDPFFTTKRAQGGSGLGLAVSSRIVSNHGGTMSFHSQVGAGTRVTVRIRAIE